MITRDPERPEARVRELPCGCVLAKPGDEPQVLCRSGARLSREVESLIPPYGDDDPDSWEVFHDALADYRRHLGGAG